MYSKLDYGVSWFQFNRCSKACQSPPEDREWPGWTGACGPVDTLMKVFKIQRGWGEQLNFETLSLLQRKQNPSLYRFHLQRGLPSPVSPSQNSCQTVSTESSSSSLSAFLCLCFPPCPPAMTCLYVVYLCIFRRQLPKWPRMLVSSVWVPITVRSIH